MEAFESPDFYQMDTLFSEEELMVRSSIRHFVDAEILPVIAGHFEAGTFPMDLIPKLGGLGVFGASIKGYGCAGLNPLAYGLLMQELERGRQRHSQFCQCPGRALYVSHLQIRYRSAKTKISSADGKR